MKQKQSEIDVRVAEKVCITIPEAAQLYSIGEKKLRALVDEHPDANWILRSGAWVRIKRKQFDAFIDILDTI